MKFRLLNADDIECRVSTVNEKGLSLLIYKNARVDMSILDEAVGIFNWQRKHYELKGNIYCSVGIRNTEDSDWVWKDDAGSESQTEAIKGEASDSFKRACFNWGIGRELYTAPFIWVGAGNYTESKNKAGKPTTYDKFSVEKIKYDEKTNEIVGLAIRNNKTNKRVFLWQKEGAK